MPGSRIFVCTIAGATVTLNASDMARATVIVELPSGVRLGPMAVYGDDVQAMKEKAFTLVAGVLGLPSAMRTAPPPWREVTKG